MVNPAFWRGRRVFLTGHTGIKGAWLSLWLERLGAEVEAYSLDPPTTPSLHEMAKLRRHTDGDIRNLAALGTALAAAKPEIVFHLAAQPLVRASYRDPVATFETNVIGTVNLLEAVRCAASVSAVVAVTTDKCYAEGADAGVPHVESDPMGGTDPYSASKSCAEIAAHSYGFSFFGGDGGPALATARAGNILAGGDFAEERLLPDVARALASGQPLHIRNPNAVRPWQHVLDPLAGYLILAERLVEQPMLYRGGWNFGPPADKACSVETLIEKVRAITGGQPAVTYDQAPGPAERTWLRLDSTKAHQRLGWRTRLDLAEALRWSLDWYLAAQRDPNAARSLCMTQIERYEELPALDNQRVA